MWVDALAGQSGLLSRIFTPQSCIRGFACKVSQTGQAHVRMGLVCKRVSRGLWLAGTRFTQPFTMDYLDSMRFSVMPI